MQCFQKDPNLRVTARKLLRHPWITGSRRAVAPVSKAPSNFSQAVEEVKQWNKALKSSESSLRASTGSEAGPSTRFMGGTPGKAPLSIAKPRPGAEAFRKPELAGMSQTFMLLFPITLNLNHPRFAEAYQTRACLSSQQALTLAHR